MLIALALIGGGVLGLRALVRRSEGKTGALAKGVAGFPKIRIDPGINPDVPCSGNPPPPAGMAYWGASVTPAQQQWAVRTLNTYKTGTIVEDIVEGQPIAARVEWHTWTTGPGGEHVSGCYKGVSLMRYTSPAHTGATVLRETKSRDHVAGEMLARALVDPKAPDVVQAFQRAGYPLVRVAGVDIVGPPGTGYPIWGPWPGRWDRLQPRQRIGLPPNWPPMG